jgi:XTP/dITP diphosphohydrolase
MTRSFFNPAYLGKNISVQEMTMSQILIATNNPGKQKEIRALLADLDVRFVTPNEIGLYLDVEEDGQTYHENAAKKAVAFSKATGLIALADDTGLEVAALDNAPGLYSARFAPQPRATDADRRVYLLEQLESHPKPWPARFRCIVAIATPDGALDFTEGICQGEIITEERGEKGFGYDPIFQMKNSAQTMAELNLGQKNQISHRALAVRAAFPILKNHLKTST